MNLLKILMLSCAGMGLGGCETSNVAVKALGPNAVKVNTAFTSQILAPGIYRIRTESDDGVELTAVCPKDFQTQTALKGLARTSLVVDGALQDDNPFGNFSISIPDFGLGFVSLKSVTATAPVTLEKVQGYTINRTPEIEGNAADYMMKNVASNCRTTHLHGQLLFVTDEARGKQVSRVHVGGIAGAATVSVFTGTLTNTERVEYVKPNVTFGVKGEARSLPPKKR